MPARTSTPEPSEARLARRFRTKTAVPRPRCSRNRCFCKSVQWVVPARTTPEPSEARDTYVSVPRPLYVLKVHYLKREYACQPRRSHRTRRVRPCLRLRARRKLDHASRARRRREPSCCQRPSRPCYRDAEAVGVVVGRSNQILELIEKLRQCRCAKLGVGHIPHEIEYAICFIAPCCPCVTLFQNQSPCCLLPFPTSYHAPVGFKVRVHKGKGVSYVHARSPKCSRARYILAAVSDGNCPGSVPAQIHSSFANGKAPRISARPLHSSFNFSGLPCAASVKASSCASTGKRSRYSFLFPLFSYLFRRRLVRYFQTTTSASRIRPACDFDRAAVPVNIRFAVVNLERLFSEGEHASRRVCRRWSYRRWRVAWWGA